MGVILLNDRLNIMIPRTKDGIWVKDRYFVIPCLKNGLVELCYTFMKSEYIVGREYESCNREKGPLHEYVCSYDVI